MKLLIQIPCYNEENDILNTLNQLPKKLDGVDIIEIVIVNDGSEDNTIKEVKKYNDLKTHIINLPIRKGLSNAFTTGINFCLKQSADIIVNTDADNQYDSSNIQDLINPIINGKSDIVIEQLFKNIKVFPKQKFFQNLGSKVISFLAGKKVEDATSGFRSFSKEAAGSAVFNNFTYP